MSGFCGWITYNKQVDNKNEILFKMTDKITAKKENEKWYYQDDFINIGHNRNKVNDEQDNIKPIMKICNGKKYVIIYNGEIYNKEEIKGQVISNGIKLDTCLESDIIVSSYILWKENCVNHLRGAFSFVIWDKNNNKLFLARDHLGIKPLFYTLINNTLVFGTEIKCLFEYPDIIPILNKDGISQLFGLGPARIPGRCIFKNIKEIKPANYGVFNNLQLELINYWKLESYELKDGEEKIIENVKTLVNNSIKEQLNSNLKIGTMLSGGLDSSIITAIATKKSNNTEKLKSFSVDYIDNEKHFKSNDFQPDSDARYIDMIKDMYDFEHKLIKLDSKVLIDNLYEAMIARDLPGMGDIDVSLLEFAKEIKKDVDVVLSGEFADEIFGGYPWFHREECLDSDTFPWSISLDTRQEILNEKYCEIDLKKFVDEIYKQEIEKVPIFEGDNSEEKKIKKLMYLNIYWFGETLIDRTDRMALRSGLNIRVPFTDYRILEYVWNIPWKMKTMMNREKGLLRFAYKDILPKDVCFRKKSPYPKTYNPEYTLELKKILIDILNNNDSPINELINKEAVIKIINNLDETFKRPWFGQLMTGPQFIAYLIQINMWLNEYKPKIEM